MEYFWCFAAALAAGVGTGLAGLSAATVMVPIMIVLCPSFAGETGAYHATAIALASDILGSAFTSAIYIRNKNIDLKRGGVMMACIITMCVAGSAAAWFAGSRVLGTFSLFLCLGIGIRFLLKPDTQRADPVDRGARLDGKGLAISLFFGLTIGFGTGFVGSGGGMMMLVVFTAFLGMPLKPSVGTSTLIMTFTALIAFVSHALIDPAIVLQRWDVLVLCMVTETAASIFSARFANRVSNKVVGLVTGAVLTVLGLIMLGIHYREALAGIPLLMDILSCMGSYLVFLGCCVAALLVIKFVLKPYAELFRKLLHIVAYSSSLYMMYESGDWRVASLCCFLFAVVVYPILHLAEKWSGFGELFVQRKAGEIKKSLLILFFTHAVLIALCYGWLGKSWIVTTSILVWGTGDTMAALVGKRFGRHPIRFSLADGKKTWEGTGAMAVTALAVGLATLLVTAPYPRHICLVLALVVAPVAAFVELISHNGNDTATVASSVAAVLAVLAVLL